MKKRVILKILLKFYLLMKKMNPLYYQTLFYRDFKLSSQYFVITCESDETLETHKCYRVPNNTVTKKCLI